MTACDAPSLCTHQQETNEASAGIDERIFSIVSDIQCKNKWPLES